MTPETPLGAAVLWQLAIEDPETNEGALSMLMADPADWDGFGEAASILAELSAATHPVFDPEHADTIAHIKFIDYAGEGVARSMAEAVLDDVWMLTLLSDASFGSMTPWRVWGLTHNGTPTAAAVLGHG